MPIDLPPALAGFRPIEGLSGDARIGLGADRQVTQTGTQSRLNIFARAWDFITRTDAQVDANKRVAEEFVRGIEASYGKEVAQLASEQLKGQLHDGRPLTASRVEKVLAKSREIAGEIQAGNRHVLERNLGPIVEGGINRAFAGRVSDDVLSPQERREVVQRAIESDPKFKEVTYNTGVRQFIEDFGGGDEDLGITDQAFVEHFTEVASLALERAAQAKLTPAMMGIIERHGDPRSSVEDEFGTNHPDRLGLPPEQSRAMERQGLVIKSISTGLAEGSTPERVMLGQIADLRRESGDPAVPGGPRVRDMALDGPAGEYRDAMVSDMRLLDRILSEKTGMDKLDPGVQRAILSANSIGQGARDAAADGNFRPMDNAVASLAQMRADLDAMRASPVPEDPKAQALLQQSIEQAVQNIRFLEVCHNARTSGVTHDDMQAILASGKDLEEVLSRLGDTGFHGTDVAWLHAQGMPVGEALMRFTPTEAALLRANGIGIDVGLQYKEKGIPIHARTMVGELRDDLRVGEPRALTGGAVSRPFAVTYGDRPMVYKEGDPKHGYGPQSAALGIPKDDPRMPARNIATKAVDELLGFGIVPDTRCAMMEGRLGVAMDFVRGSAPMKVLNTDITGTEEAADILKALEDLGDDEDSKKQYLQLKGARVEGGRVFVEEQRGVRYDFTDAAMRRELVKLQLLDGICAQGDRHLGNYIVELGGDGRFARLRAIDNDQAFGPKVVNPNALLRYPEEDGHIEVGGQLFGDSDMNGVMMPPVVDRAMKDAVDGTTPEALRARLSGLLPEREVEAAVLRLQAMKAHIAKLETEGNVIETGDWGTPRVIALLADPNTSYVARDQQAVLRLPSITYEAARS